MGKAIGGYVRRCERKPAGRSEPLLPMHRRPWPYPEPPTFQCMPILRFEEFDVGESVDSPGMTPLESWYAKRQRTERPDPRGR